MYIVDADNPLPNGNRNVLGIIARNSIGMKLWGALGRLEA